LQIGEGSVVETQTVAHHKQETDSQPNIPRSLFALHAFRWLYVPFTVAVSLVWAAGVLGAAGCKSQPSPHNAHDGGTSATGTENASVSGFQLHSSAFQHQGAMDTKYTCEGIDVSPPLKWQGAPSATKSFALIVEDPDAPDPKAPTTVFVHWVVYNLAPTTLSLPEGAGKPTNTPQGIHEGISDWKKTGYHGPCPPIGRHRYFHKLYALDTKLDGLEHPTKNELLQAMKGHILAETQLVGTYEKLKRL
jgi:Raf kinase inhibitor-like YbhB/YbcL family protein